MIRSRSLPMMDSSAMMSAMFSRIDFAHLLAMPLAVAGAAVAALGVGGDDTGGKAYSWSA